MCGRGQLGNCLTQPRRFTLQSAVQRACFRAFGHNDVILVDTTHKVSSTDYKLATVMVVSKRTPDEFGVPIAFAVVSCEQERMLEVRMRSCGSQWVGAVASPRWLRT